MELYLKNNINSEFLSKMSIPYILLDTFIIELNGLSNYSSNVKNKNKCYNLIFKYRILIMKILNIEFDFDYFVVFRFIKKIKVGKNKYVCNNIQIIFNDNYSVKFENYDFQFLKSYLLMENNSKYEFHFNNSLNSIIMINSNNKNKPYIHNSAISLPNQSQVCFNKICNIKYSIKYDNLKEYRNFVIKYMIDALVRQLKYSSRGFNCLNNYFEINYNEIWFIYDFYINTENRVNIGKQCLYKLISQCFDTQIAISNCYIVEKFNIEFNKNTDYDKTNN